MYLVEVIVGGSTSNYWASLSTEDQSGRRHTKQIGQAREATVNSNILQGMIDAVKNLNRKCMLDIYVESDHIAATWQNGWVKSWESHGWTNAKGREVRNRAQWEELKRLLDGHAVRMYYREKKK